MKKLNNKFVVVIPTWNAKDLIKDCILSVMMQDFDDVGIIIRDDLSDDGTYEEITSLLGIDGINENYTRKGGRDVIFHRNEKKYYACGNIWTSVYHYVENDDAAIGTVDGDDKLINEGALSMIYSAYEHGKWIVWTQHIDPAGNVGCSQQLPPDKMIYTSRYYWSVSHFRTAKAFLYKKIQKEHLIDPFNGNEFMWLCGDAALLFPLIEMSGKDRGLFIDEITYLYNNLLPTNDHKMNLDMQHKYSAAIKNYPRYTKLP